MLVKPMERTSFIVCHTWDSGQVVFISAIWTQNCKPDPPVSGSQSMQILGRALLRGWHHDGLECACIRV